MRPATYFDVWAAALFVAALVTVDTWSSWALFAVSVVFQLAPFIRAAIARRAEART